ncbi:hypothetical protein LIER_41475 [Lithospermum erythrorhizon]|uniref:Reverse transcriptase zinc-binding domain-containing protein n=1 Tax=Lithospermum erythrorhizon TaxID=34254 RepID=A0AAV3RE16_LITER
MWIKWINTYRLKGKSVWGVHPKSIDSWTWKELLKLRVSLKPFIKYAVENGENVSFLFDNWHKLGILNENLSSRDISLLRIDPNDSVASALKKIRSPRGRHTSKMLSVCEGGIPELNPNCSVVVLWNGALNVTSSAIWNAIRRKQPQPMWLCSWEVVEDSKCVFCDEVENANHLLFACHFSACIWRRLLMYVKDFHLPRMWDQEVQIILQNGLANNFRNKVRKLVTSSAVYNIWNERNQRIFQQKSIDSEYIVGKIVSSVRSRVNTWRKIPRTKVNWLYV